MTIENKPYLNRKKAIIFLFFIALMCAILCGCSEKNVKIPELSPEQIVEYIDIYHLESDKTEKEILNGEEYQLYATDETADLLFRISFFTTGLHGELYQSSPMGSSYPLDEASKEFLELYKQAHKMKEKYTAHLTEHWKTPDAFLRVEQVEHYPAEMYWFYKNIPIKMLNRILFEENGMDLVQYLDFIRKYSLIWDKGSWIEYDGTGYLIATNMTAEKTFSYNDKFWNSSEYHKGKELAEEFGLTKEQPLTFEWVFAYPKEAYSLSLSVFREYDFHWIYYRIIPEDKFEEWNIPILVPDMNENEDVKE